MHCNWFSGMGEAKEVKQILTMTWSIIKWLKHANRVGFLSHCSSCSQMLASRESWRQRPASQSCWSMINLEPIVVRNGSKTMLHIFAQVLVLELWSTEMAQACFGQKYNGWRLWEWMVTGGTESCSWWITQQAGNGNHGPCKMPFWESGSDLI